MTILIKADGGYSGVGWCRARVFARCQDVEVQLNPGLETPPVSRIATFSNGAEVFVATEEGANMWMSAVDKLEDMASSPLLAVDARNWYDLWSRSPQTEMMGIQAWWFTEAYRPRDDMWNAMLPIMKALASGRRIIFFCKAGRHRSFQLALWLLMPYFDNFEEAVAFVASRRTIVQASCLWGHSVNSIKHSYIRSRDKYQASYQFRDQREPILCSISQFRSWPLGRT